MNEKLRNAMDPAYHASGSFHAIDYGKLELRTLALARQKQLVDKWRAFLALEPNELNEQDPELVEDAQHEATSPEWTGGPVAAFAPDVCEEFRAISKLLGKLHRSNPIGWAKTYQGAPLLFRLGCDFGEAVETVNEDESEPEARIEAMNKARALWFAIATLAPDAK